MRRFSIIAAGSPRTPYKSLPARSGALRRKVQDSLAATSYSPPPETLAMHKTLIPLALLAAAAAPFAIASAGDDGDGPGRHGRAEFMIDHLLDTVDATDAQRTQIDAIKDKYEDQFKALHKQIHENHRG